MNVIGGGAMDKNAPIGLFDSGIGGLTVVKAMKKILPESQKLKVSIICMQRLRKPKA